MKLHKNEISYLLFVFFQDLGFVYPIYTIMFREHGLSFTEISVLMAVWTAAALLFEIPSGIIADLWSRKLMVLFAPAIKAAGFVLWLAMPGFFGFALGFVLWGAAEASISGTLDALLYDALLLRGREETFERVIGIANAVARFAIIIAMAAGGLLYRVSPEAVLALSAAAVAAAGLCVLPMDENRGARVKQSTGDGSSGEGSSGNVRPEGGAQVRSVRELVRMSREVFSLRGMTALVAFGSIAGGAYGMLDEYDTLFGVRVGVPVAFIGFWGAVRFGLEAAGGLLAPGLNRILSRVRIGRRFGRKLTGPPGVAAAAGAALLLGTLHRAVLPLYFLFYFFMAAFEVGYETALQRRLESAGRATLGSIASFFNTVVGMVLGLAFGLIAERWGLSAMFAAGAALVLVAALTYALKREPEEARARE